MLYIGDKFDAPFPSSVDDDIVSVSIEFVNVFDRKALFVSSLPRKLVSSLRYDEVSCFIILTKVFSWFSFSLGNWAPHDPAVAAAGVIFGNHLISPLSPSWKRMVRCRINMEV